MSEADIVGDAGAGRQVRARVDYPSNSRRRQAPGPEKPERPKIESVVTGEVRKRKENILSRAFHDIVAEDGRSVAHYVLMEVLLPAAKSTISDVVSSGIERMLYGDTRPRRGTRPGYTNYSSSAIRSSAPLSDPRPPLSRQARASHEFGEILIVNRADAEEVLDRLRDLINQYDVATVADFKELAGITGDFTDNAWGWDDLRSAQVRVVRGGYVIDLPRTIPIA
jgi:hypothetical protein